MPRITATTGLVSRSRSTAACSISPPPTLPPGLSIETISALTRRVVPQRRDLLRVERAVLR